MLKGVKGIWLWISGSIMSFFIFFKSIMLFSMKIRGQKASILYELVKTEGKFFTLREEYCDDPLPKEFKAIGFLKGVWFLLNISERVLQAGFVGTDMIIYITLLRWDVKKVKSFIKNKKIVREDIPVYMMQPWDNEKISVVKQIPNFYEFIYPDYQIINNEIDRIVLSEKGKIGIILHGPPGNGKSFLIQHFSLKYNIPIYLFSLVKDLDNHNIIRMFARTRGPAIVLTEDFDTFYNKRKCLLWDPKFTFDTILNVIDGTFSNDNKLIYFMTANDINKIDFALKGRPSRFKLIVKVDNPSRRAKETILSDYLPDYPILRSAIINKDYSLDVVLFAKESIEHGINPYEVATELIPKFLVSQQESKQEAEDMLEKQKELAKANQSEAPAAEVPRANT